MIHLKQRKKVKKRYIVLMILALCLSSSILFFQFTSIGYRMTVMYRNFTEVQDHVYISNDYSGDKQKVISVLDESTKRVSAFWGSLESSPIIIICDNQKTLEKLGGDHDTATLVLFDAYSFISISSEYLNVDVMAHELTHAELHTRLYHGKLPQKLVPTWFDEGVATQNDYREKYNDDAWKKATNNGLNVLDFRAIDTAPEFNQGETSERIYRYIVSRHELKEWIERNGMDGLLELISGVNDGVDFYDLYHTE